MRNVLLSSLTAVALTFAGSAFAECSANHAALSASLDKAPAASVAPAPTKQAAKAPPTSKKSQQAATKPESVAVAAASREPRKNKSD